MVSVCVYSDHDAGVCFLFLPEAAKKTVCHPGGAVDRIGRKDLDFTVSYASEDEMGRLCASFEEMRKSLEENQKKCGSWWRTRNSSMQHLPMIYVLPLR
ncbi:MAG: HAMP domain-containing protein [Sellimonas intestinalis]